MQFFLKKVNKLNRGFTLVETLVAVSIFSMSILALMSVLAGGISDIGYAKQKMIATHLAQEGIEYIRNMRDTFVLYDASSQVGWDAFNDKVAPTPTTLCASVNGCYLSDTNIDYSNHSQPMALQMIVTACGSFCPEFLYDNATGKYGIGSGSSSGFIPRIRVAIVSPNEIKVFSTISWTQGSGLHSVTFSENLFNWVE